MGALKGVRCALTGMLLLLDASSAWASVPATRPEDSFREENRGRFARLLREGDTERAGRFLPLFGRAEAKEPELLAQYQLLSCQPRSASSTIERIANPVQ